MNDPEVVQFLADEIRAGITAAADPQLDMSKGWVADREWSPPASNPNKTPPVWQVVIRDDGIDDGELVVGSWSGAISTLAGSVKNPSLSARLAKLVKSIVKATPRAEAGNPVAAVQSLLGPYPVEDPSTYARRYMAVVLTVVGAPS